MAGMNYFINSWVSIYWQDLNNFQIVVFLYHNRNRIIVTTANFPFIGKSKWAGSS